MKTLIALTALALATAPAAAKAPQTGAWQISQDSYHLYYADLDMNSTRGRATLLTRVRAYAERLCDAPLKADQDACVADTVAHIANADVRRALADQAATQLAAR